MSADVDSSAGVVAEPLVTAPPNDAPPDRRVRPDQFGVAVWMAIVALALIWLDDLGRARNFFYDEWNFVTDRWRLDLDSFLQPHNGHLSIVPATIFLALFRIVGLDDFRVFRLVGLLVHAGVATAVLVYIRPRLGWVAAVAGGSIVLLLGSGWQNVLWPFQIGFMGSVLAFVLLLVALDRSTRAGDIAAAALLLVALGSSGVGVAVAFAAAVEVALTRPWRRWWIVAAPGVVYAIWYLLYGDSQAHMSNADAVPGYVTSSGSSAVAGFFGVGLDWGRVGFGVLVGLGVAALAHRRGVPVRILALLAMLLAFWSLTALSRGQFGDPGASRYVYVGAVVVLLLVVEFVVGFDKRIVPAVAAVIAVLSVWSTSDLMRAGGGGLVQEGEIITAQLPVLEALREHAADDQPVDPLHAPGLLAGPYFAATDGLGSSPAPGIEVVAELPDYARAGADRLALEIVPPDVVPAGGDRCTAPPEQQVAFAPGSGVVIEAPGGPVAVTIRRWASTPVPLLEVAPGAPQRVTFAADGIAVPWTLQVDGTAAFCPVEP